MKVVQDNPSFKPVTITLEDQKEVDLFVALVGGMTEAVGRAFGIGDVSKMYDQLDSLASPLRPFVTVKLSERS